jgi:tetratricopeptide (TPR) repeat protein
MVKKSSLMEDPIFQTLVAAIAAMMAKLANLVTAGEYQQALDEIDNELEDLVGLKSDQLEALSDDFILDLLTVNEFLDVQRLWFLAELFHARGEIRAAQGRRPEGVSYQVRALKFFIEVAFAATEEIPEVGRRIDSSFGSLRNELPEETTFSLYDLFERRGDYNKAEAALDRMLALTGDDSDLLAEKREFQSRMAQRQGRKADPGGVDDE